MIKIDACELLGRRDLQETLWGYTRGIEAIESSIGENKIAGNIAFPLFFLIRHSLEIGLKHNISFLCKYSESDNLCNENKREGHSLERLSNSFSEHWKFIFKKYSLKKANYEEEYPILESLIFLKKLTKFIDKIDNSSLKFRYENNEEKKVVGWERYGITMQELESYGDFIEDEYISDKFFESYKNVIQMLSYLEQSLHYYVEPQEYR